jgi:hypothetical protein
VISGPAVASKLGARALSNGNRTTENQGGVAERAVSSLTRG